ncbi:hypothetical protein ANACOL_03416 [Anaerotruncus colihominis DSM 17241]|uniref:Uncharacterized protein n=1 Tax=Anaerotruncus colihominis DSM 17241 TaxID=445972 RepID=B0PF37_9FIRM|nr:hypothetical protein ANACOL_03416 [Anaerotruncus colihominis DSM 17241]
MDSKPNIFIIILSYLQPFVYRKLYGGQNAVNQLAKAKVTSTRPGGLPKDRK